MVVHPSFRRRLALRVLICLLAAPVSHVWAEDAASSTSPQPESRAEGAGDVWTLERAINRALEANPDLLSAKYEFERQEGARLQMVARLLPQVTGSGSVNQRQRSLVDYDPHRLDRDHPVTSLQTGIAIYGYDFRVEVRQTVFDGLSSWSAAKRQRLLSQQAFLVLESAVSRTVSSVRQGFDAIQLRTAVVEAERRRLDEYAQLVDMTERKQKAGDIPEFELLRAQAEMEGARADLAEAMRALAQADQSFRRLLQIPETPGVALKLEGHFEPRPFDLPLEDAISTARLHRPDLEAASLAVKAARAGEKAEIGSMLPKFDVFASYDTRSSYYNSGLELSGWSYGAVGQWNIFEGGASRGRRMALRADRRNAEVKLAEAEHGVVSKLHELYEGLHQARVAMEAQRKSVDMSERAWRDARRLYEVGQASLEQVLEASMTRRRAESRLGEAIYNYNATVAEIEFAVGGQVSDSIKVPDTWKP